MELGITGIISFKTWLDPDIHASVFITICIWYSGWYWLEKKGCTSKDLNIFTEGNFKKKKKSDSHSPSIHLKSVRNSDSPWVMGLPSEEKDEVSWLARSGPGASGNQRLYKVH